MQRELRLLYPMTVLYVSNFLYIAYFVLCDYWINTQNPFSRNAEWTAYVASDAYDLNSCYVIMITSREVRVAVLKFLKVYLLAKKR
uniref:G_PROTEIN_RECEP_F1_2 domain-containing protein n=1 Tax=Panagrellus redivivus TaxID=6233 RepID=A0A7E4VU48_PANRE